MSKAQWTLDRQYAEIMKNHPFGLALYRPLPLSVFSPGSCGYFDDFGSWNPITHLENDVMLTKKGLEKVPEEDALDKAPVDNGITWGPKTSANVKATKLELSAGIDPGLAIAIPVTVSAIYSYSVDADVGGILLTSSPVTHEHYYHSSPFKNWSKKNAQVILRRWPEVKKHGMWLVTSTYAAKKCAINMTVAKGRGFKVGFAAEAMGLGKLVPCGEWRRSHMDEGWGEYTTEGDDKSVVFFGGLKFKYTQMIGKDLIHVVDTPVLRGTIGSEVNIPEVIDVVPDPENEENSFMVECQKYLGEDDEEAVEQDAEW
ncbi:hypothetical protein GALMADRAFT_101440 [Galerina marginata CBS 339.88]|uniref:Uncharacterized protein n=1 Tax=Galerina marginata (strain CBS 339.88) TaxID=685588 RepID=A0A067SQ03_GALM3|nr:hypothetical protein GALMADRAFT_101440 [Galerina marginata CBS 339.88]